MVDKVMIYGVNTGESPFLIEAVNDTDCGRRRASRVSPPHVVRIVAT